MLSAAHEIVLPAPDDEVGTMIALAQQAMLVAEARELHRAGLADPPDGPTLHDLARRLLVGYPHHDAWRQALAAAHGIAVEATGGDDSAVKLMLAKGPGYGHHNLVAYYLGRGLVQSWRRDHPHHLAAMAVAGRRAAWELRHRPSVESPRVRLAQALDAAGVELDDFARVCAAWRPAPGSGQVPRIGAPSVWHSALIHVLWTGQAPEHAGFWAAVEGAVQELARQRGLARGAQA